jgi:type IV fimbrial biogenesis protein FimT
MKSQCTGLTLIELIVSLAIIAVLFGIALPSFGDYIEASRASAAKSALLASLTRAASRAAISGEHAVLCPTDDGATCTGAPDWTGGWIAFLDTNNDRVRDAGESLILHELALAGKVRLRSTVGRTRIVFQPNGGNAGSNVTFTLCDGRGPKRAETLVLNNVGRMRIGTPTAKAIAETCPG